jgi:hypothetical protein
VHQRHRLAETALGNDQKIAASMKHYWQHSSEPKAIEDVARDKVLPQRSKDCKEHEQFNLNDRLKHCEFICLD